MTMPATSLDEHEEYLRELRVSRENGHGLDMQGLNDLAVRLDRHAEDVVNVSEIERDLQKAARVASDMASLRFHIREIAALCTDENAARLLRELVGP